MNKKSPITNHQSLITNFGFTLIELLVVISILGLLAGLVISNMAGVRERARDAERKSDLKEIQNALEMYKHDQSVPKYPATASWASNLKDGGYMKVVPTDPSGLPAPYSYTLVGADKLDYTLYACLENASDKQGVAESDCVSGLKFQIGAP